MLETCLVIARFPRRAVLTRSTKQASPRVEPAVTYLSKFPREMVHRVLDDLPLKTILGLATYHCDRDKICEAASYMGTSYFIFSYIVSEVMSRDGLWARS